jgi:hypothetical protein
MKVNNNNNNFVLGLLGVVLFFLVISVLYIFIFLSNVIMLADLQFLVLLVVFSGFFIFLVAAMLLALSIYRAFNKIRKDI